MTRVLLDTNILIHREARTIIRDDIGTLFNWLDQLGLKKVVHPASIAEVRKHADPAVVRTLAVKLESYTTLKTLAPDTPDVAALRAGDRTDNDTIDTSLLAELAGARVDLLITEDRGIHRKAAVVGISSRVFTIDAFLEKVTAENPQLADYKVLSVQKVLFGNVKLADPFFDSFRADYPGFDLWFTKKSDETAYTCTADDGSVVAFLYVKREGPDENYADIEPRLGPAKRLKIGTFKVVSNGYKLGERFLKIVFDNALLYHVEEIYVTIFRRTADQERLYGLLEEWGFRCYAIKTSAAGVEDVLVRDFRPHVELADPRRTFPYLSRAARKFIVPIYPEYHTELLPDSILRNESPVGFKESKPNRNSLSKVYVSRSLERGLRSGDIIVFYRTAAPGQHAYYSSVVTTLGVVQDVADHIPNLDTFIRLCRKRSVFSDEELKRHWDWSTTKPFVVNFLYVYSFPIRPNRKALLESGALGELAPRGFEQLSDDAFYKILALARADTRLVVG